MESPGPFHELSCDSDAQTSAMSCLQYSCYVMGPHDKTVMLTAQPKAHSRITQL